MQRYKILHRTYYNFSDPVKPGPHVLLLRPRESYELRIESFKLDITPAASVKWHRDVEDNSVAVAVFDSVASQIVFESETVIQQYQQTPLDFLVADYAINYPFDYSRDDLSILTPYLEKQGDSSHREGVKEWVASLWQTGEKIQTYALLDRLNRDIRQNFVYQIREEPGVQSPAKTTSLRSGSCRDFATLLMAAAQHLGMAARFVSGYLNTPPSITDLGATHAWAEIYIPGAGWKGFDPTNGEVVGGNHIAVAVARLPESVPPVSGSYVGNAGSTLDVGVWVTELTWP
ncbi:MAG: transglutaminase family protein [Verrucomicrobiales bacterium]|nr:transglutaminase family protein [Verrucomicrobiales bacterium]